MNRRVLLALALVLGSAFAGCMGDETPAAEDAAPPAASGEEAAANATVDDGTAPMDVDVGHQPHLHDYWKDQTRVTLMDQDLPSDAFMTTFMTFFNAFRGTPGVGGAFVELPDGAIVFEGTGQLELTVSWSDPTVTGLGARYRSAASTEFSEPQALTSGAPLVVPVTPEMSDMPHAKTSKWRFLLAPSQPGQVVAGTVHVKVDIVRMGDIMLFPGHPEHFGDASTLTLFEGAATSTQDSFVTRIASFATGGSEDTTVPFAKVVPMEAQSMTANVTIKSANAEVGKVTDVMLLVKSADRNGFRAAKMVSGDPATGAYQFAWLVEMEETDSPYADESQWRFTVRVATDPIGNGVIAQCGGCSDAQVEFDATIVAYDAPVEGAEELQNMGRGGG